MRKKLRQFPPGFGYCCLTESVNDEEVFELAAKLLGSLDYRGIGCVEFKRDPRDGQPKLIEINTRAVRTSVLAIAAGVDFPWIAYQDCAGTNDIQPILSGKVPVRWVHLRDEIWAAGRLIARGELSPITWIRGFLGKPLVVAEFSWDDLSPGLLSWAQVPRRLAKLAFRRNRRAAPRTGGGSRRTHGKMTIQCLRRDTVPCVVMRGGTTRGFFFQPRDIPSDPALRDRMFIDLVAGPDLRQADALGGGDMLLNKIATVWASERDDTDVECTFGVVTPGSSRVKYGSNCGNLVSAVALYAVEEALRLGLEDAVRLFNPQSGTRIDARFMDAGEFRDHAAGVKQAGMAMTGVPVELAFIDPASTIGRGLLPTGRAVDRLRLPSGAEIDASIVDSGTVYVFVTAADLGLDHSLAPLDSRQQADILAIAETLRGQAAALCGLVDDAADARRISPAVPKISIVSPSHAFAIRQRPRLHRWRDRHARADRVQPERPPLVRGYRRDRHHRCGRRSGFRRQPHRRRSGRRRAADAPHRAFERRA